MKKRLIAIMAAGIITTATLTGCSTTESYVGGNTYKDKYIVLEDKDGKDILHKGTYIEGYKDANNAFDFECAEMFITNRQHTTYDNEPAETEYDEKCEHCFNND